MVNMCSAGMFIKLDDFCYTHFWGPLIKILLPYSKYLKEFISGLFKEITQPNLKLTVNWKVRLAGAVIKDEGWVKSQHLVCLEVS